MSIVFPTAKRIGIMQFSSYPLFGLYEFVILCRRHWNLLIFCNSDKPLQSKIQTTCMLLLDSMQMSGPRQLEPAIRKYESATCVGIHILFVAYLFHCYFLGFNSRFLLDAYEAENRPVTKQAISKIPLLIPKVMIL